MQSIKKYRSGWRSFYYFLLWILILLGVLYCFFIIAAKVRQKDILKYEQELARVQRILSQFGQQDRYAKMSYAKKIEQQYTGMPWSERIQTIINVIKNLQNTVGYDDSNTIKLSNFMVTLDHLTVKGEVSNLWVLYGNSSNGRYTGLIDVFRGFDFVKNIQIRHYQKATNVFAFTVDADLTLGDKK